MELWDIYTADGTFTGRTIDRHGDERIPEGFYHISCEVLVRHKDGDLLLMERAKTKKEYGGCYETTAGGSAKSGESPEECVRRELLEETGLTAGELTLVDKRLSEKYKTIFFSYVTTVSCDKDNVTLQQGETEGYLWVTPAELRKILGSGRDIDILTERYMSYYIESGILEG